MEQKNRILSHLTKIEKSFVNDFDDCQLPTELRRMKLARRWERERESDSIFTDALNPTPIFNCSKYPTRHLTTIRTSIDIDMSYQ